MERKTSGSRGRSRGNENKTVDVDGSSSTFQSSDSLLAGPLQEVSAPAKHPRAPTPVESSPSNSGAPSSAYETELEQVEKVRKLLRQNRMRAAAKAFRKQPSEGSLLAHSVPKGRSTSPEGLPSLRSNAGRSPQVGRSSSLPIEPEDWSLLSPKLPETETERMDNTTATSTDAGAPDQQYESNTAAQESALTEDSIVLNGESDFYRPYTVPLHGSDDEWTQNSSDDDSEASTQLDEDTRRASGATLRRRQSSLNSIVSGKICDPSDLSASAAGRLQRKPSMTSRETQRRRNLFKNTGMAISFFQRRTKNFIISQGDIDPKDIVDRLGLPKYEVARIDHQASVPGQAFAHGYVRRRVEVRKAAMEMITTSFEKFHFRKSFWTIVPKIPSDAKSIKFADSQRRLFRKDTSEGDHESSLTDSFGYGSDESLNASRINEEEMIDKVEKANFFVTRVSENVVLVRANEDEGYVDFFKEFDIPDLELPSGYDVLINPFFFAGDHYLDEVARDTTCCVSREDFVYGSTLAPVTGRGFLLCFGQAWQDYVLKLTDRCKDGRDGRVKWPKFLDKIHSPTGPAPDYFDIPKGYWIYAAGMMLGIYKNVGVRELWAVGGLVGMYSFARRQQAVDHNRDIALVFAMLREATYGCRSRRLGVRLLHYLPSVYHDDYFALCTLPWSSSELISRTQEKSVRRKPDSDLSSHRRHHHHHHHNHHQAWHRSFRTTYEKAGREKRSTEALLKRIHSSMKNFVIDNDDESDDCTEIQLTSSRYLVTVDNPKDRGTMNFLGAIGLEMVGIEYPTLIEDYMNVISESFFDFEDAKQQLREFSNSQEMLPGAVLRAANFTESSGGVLNVIQEGVNTSNGHIEWMLKYSFFDAISTLLMLVGASVLGWNFNTGAFHFTMAITVLTRINEEVSVIGTFYVLVWGRKYGYMMYEDSIAQFAVPAALGAVEAAYELVDDNDENIFIARWVLVSAGGFAGGIILLTLVARLRFRITEGETYEEVLQRDGSLECLFTGENETGFRSIDHPNGPGVGPLQAQLFSLCESNGGDVASSTATAPYHVSGHWMIAGTLQRNHDLDFGMGTASETNSTWSMKESAVSEASSMDERPKDKEQSSNIV